MQEVTDRVLAQIGTLHGLPALDWITPSSAADGTLLPVLRLPTDARLLDVSRHAVATRFVTLRTVPSGSVRLLFVLGTQAALEEADAVAVAADARLAPLPLVLVCNADWRSFWQLVLEQRHCCVARRGESGGLRCDLDVDDQRILQEFVEAVGADAASGSHFAEARVTLLKTMARDRFEAVAKLRALDEAWARSLLGLPTEGGILAQLQTGLDRVLPLAAGEAIVHLKNAEDWQWEIGTWSTGSGEGLASMYEVHTLQMARAWSEVVLARSGDRAAHERAEQLTQEVTDAPNEFGPQFFAGSINALRGELAKLPRV